jgi:hypothetical protein
MGMELVGVMPTVQGFVWCYGVPTGCAEKLRWQTAGMFGEAAMAEPRDGVGKAAMAGTHKAQEGASGWVRCSHRR